MGKKYYVKHSYTLVDALPLGNAETPMVFMWGPFPYHTLAVHKACEIGVGECSTRTNPEGISHENVKIEVFDDEELLNLFDLSD